MKLKEKVALVTDGTSRIGAAIAARLAGEGAHVVVNLFPVNGGMPSTAEFVTHADPVSKVQIDAAMQEILEKYGRIDIVVFNNNEVIPANLEDCDDETYDRIMDVNVKSAYLYVIAAGTSMKKAKSGKFIFVSSIHDEKPFGGSFAYSVAKGCLKNLAREMVLDMGDFNIQTNIIEPGPVEGGTDLFYSDLSPLYEHPLARVRGKRLGTFGDITEAVLYFARDDSGFANGAELRLDGGFLLTYSTRIRRAARESSGGGSHGA
jgi:NAD(P)-dependent dehydrogenase (short-subunit alcohol dehydrogenase family)